jgi:uncharacterized phiE125 gp8 family phage protein
MSDRVPIGTIPTVTAALDGVDVLIATLGVACTVSRVLLRQTDYDDGGATDTSVTGTIRNAASGGGEGISFTIPDQGQSVVATGSLVVDADESIYLRVSAGNPTSMNLTGWIEVSDAAGVTTALTSLARVKQFLNIDGSSDDARLNTLIAAVSAEIQGSTGRKIIQATVTDERVDSIGENVIAIREYPIISVSALTEDGNALVEDAGFEMKAQDKAAGRIARISGGKAANWARGIRVVTLTYSHGYATVPEDIKQAATELVAFDYNQEKSSGARHGLSSKVLPTGGASNYLTRSEVWAAQQHRLAAYRRMYA